MARFTFLFLLFCVSACSQHEIRIASLGEFVYVINPSVMTFSSARQWCRDFGGDLATPKVGTPEVGFVRRLAVSTCHHWIGIRYSASEGWQYANGQPPDQTIEYTNKHSSCSHSCCGRIINSLNSSCSHKTYGHGECTSHFHSICMIRITNLMSRMDVSTLLNDARSVTASVHNDMTHVMIIFGYITGTNLLLASAALLLLFSTYCWRRYRKRKQSVSRRHCLHCSSSAADHVYDNIGRF